MRPLVANFPFIVKNIFYQLHGKMDQETKAAVTTYRTAGKQISFALTGLGGDTARFCWFLYLPTGWFYALIICDEAGAIHPASSLSGGGDEPQETDGKGCENQPLCRNRDARSSGSVGTPAREMPSPGTARHCPNGYTT